MLRRFILAATGSFCCITATVAKDSMSLKCTPQAGPGENHTARIDVGFDGDRFSIIHVGENGERVDRADQYAIRAKRESPTPAWEGLNKRRRYLTMVGKIIRTGEHSYDYVEQLFDAREGGAKVYETRARCLAEASDPKPAPAPVEAPAKSAAPACQTIAGAHERLDCYDKLFPPARAAASEPEAVKQPAPEPDRNAAPNLTDADLDAIRSTYEKNQARFVRDFAGRTFEASLQVDRITRSRTEKNRFDLSLERGVSCGIDDPQVVSFITNLNKGDKVRVRGLVDDIANGNVELTKCALSAAG
ncbi:hypothetical protein LMG27198_17180 [Methylocystis echinoides]|uniref:tRNA_anti-like n=2 Tax=Methylocystis echinoides TaxID=29468 RepID=A0A9W6GTG4_9HYPH|nr:hypothetical protein LMG27198_17180 [Methylocystis echinoides]